MVADTAEATRKPRNKVTARSMTKEHKAAIAEGREQAAAVGKYLAALEVHRPRRGRKVTAESLQVRLEKIETALASADPLKRLTLLQQQKDTLKQLEALKDDVDISPLEEEFVKVCKPYAERKGISRATFREVGVPDEVLKAAGI